MDTRATGPSKTEQFDMAAPETPVAQSMTGLVLQLVKPYRKWLLLIFLAMLIETVMSLAAPWPLKIILDSVVGHRALPHWLDWMNHTAFGESRMGLAAAAALGVVLIAVIGAIAGYIDNYFTESVAQYVANDLRLRAYHHMQR